MIAIYLWIYRPKAISLMEVERSPILVQIVVDPRSVYLVNQSSLRWQARIKVREFLLLLINFSVVISIHKAFYLDSSDMSYLSALMSLLIHLDLFIKHIAGQGNVHGEKLMLQLCLFQQHFASSTVY